MVLCCRQYYMRLLHVYYSCPLGTTSDAWKPCSTKSPSGLQLIGMWLA